MQLFFRRLLSHPLCHLSQEEGNKYCISGLYFLSITSNFTVTHNEIVHGVFAEDVRIDSQVFWFHRVFRDLLENSHDPAARLYMDKIGDATDDEAASQLAQLVTEFRAQIPDSNYFEYPLSWCAGRGVSLEQPEHARYVCAFHTVRWLQFYICFYHVL